MDMAPRPHSSLGHTQGTSPSSKTLPASTYDDPFSPSMRYSPAQLSCSNANKEPLPAPVSFVDDWHKSSLPATRASALRGSHGIECDGGGDTDCRTDSGLQPSPFSDLPSDVYDTTPAFCPVHAEATARPTSASRRMNRLTPYRSTSTTLNEELTAIDEGLSDEEGEIVSHSAAAPCRPMPHPRATSHRERSNIFASPSLGSGTTGNTMHIWATPPDRSLTRDSPITNLSHVFESALETSTPMTPVINRIVGSLPPSSESHHGAFTREPSSGRRITGFHPASQPSARVRGCNTPPARSASVDRSCAGPRGSVRVVRPCETAGKAPSRSCSPYLATISRSTSVPLPGYRPRSRSTSATPHSSSTQPRNVTPPPSDDKNIRGDQQPCEIPTDSTEIYGWRYVSPTTVTDAIEGTFSDAIDRVLILDCRYPFEYEGGHIKGAINVWTDEMVTKLLFDENPHMLIAGQRTALILHCEFSSHRAPNILKAIRAIDRKVNLHQYPLLTYPETYLLKGGYKAFFQQHPEYTTGAYQIMDDARFADECERCLSLTKRSTRRVALQTPDIVQRCEEALMQATLTAATSDSDSLLSESSEDAEMQLF
eukprot:m.95771 g.95771  ORF g.95771 m.95771 type:complete len:597 (+) comp10123_c0_seq2:415-2205(+)